MKNALITTAFLLVLTIASASALIVNSVNTPILSPGEEGVINFEVENNLNQDAEDVSVSINLANLPFVSIGGSQESVEEINTDDEEDFSFRIKAANDISPGDYSIPYSIEFKLNDELQKREGTIGVSVAGETKLDYTISTENPVVGQQGKITLKIINKEFGDAKFVLVKVFPDGFTTLSDTQEYIGTIDSDDFESVTFDVVFKSPNPIFTARVEYKDFSNKDIAETIDLPIVVYSREKAIELGIIKQNNTILYILIAVTAILLWLLWRTLRKRARLKRSLSQAGR